MRPQVPYAIAAFLLVGSTMLMQHASRAEQAPERLPFSAFPLQIADQWQGRDLGLERDVLDVLRMDDYMMRVYVPVGDHGKGEKAKGTSEDGAARHASGVTHPASPVWLYVGYYKSQRTGATYHSPLNCLPGSGWSIVSRDEMILNHRPMNRVVIEKGLDRQLVLYWYQDRGRVITSEYWAKAYLLWDAITQNRTDGALVRVSVPIVSSEDMVGGVEEALAAGQSFLERLEPLLPAFLPV
jgi:EpsI family protein